MKLEEEWDGPFIRREKKEKVHFRKEERNILRFIKCRHFHGDVADKKIDF